MIIFQSLGGFILVQTDTLMGLNLILVFMIQAMLFFWFSCRVSLFSSSIEIILFLTLIRSLNESNRVFTCSIQRSWSCWFYISKYWSCWIFVPRCWRWWWSFLLHGSKHLILLLRYSIPELIFINSWFVLLFIWSFWI